MKNKSKKNYTTKVLNSEPFGKMFYLILTKGPQYKKNFEEFTGFNNSTISQYLNTNFELFENLSIPIFKKEGLINYNTKWNIDDKTFIEIFLHFIKKGNFDLVLSGNPIKPVNQKYAGREYPISKLKEEQKELVKLKNKIHKDYEELKKTYLINKKKRNIEETKIYKKKLDECAIEIYKLSNKIETKQDIKKHLKHKQLNEDCFYEILLPKLKDECSKISKNEFNKFPCLGFLFARALNNSGKWKKGVFEVTWKENKEIVKISKNFTVFWEWNL
jgi:hypothetical protein